MLTFSSSPSSQTLVWSSALALTLKSIVVNGGSLTSVYDDAGYLVRIGQVGSGMEVLHSISGFVPSRFSPR